MHTLSIDFLRTDTDAELCEFMARAKNGLPREPPSAQTFAPKQISTVSALFLNRFRNIRFSAVSFNSNKKKRKQPLGLYGVIDPGLDHTATHMS